MASTAPCPTPVRHPAPAPDRAQQRRPDASELERRLEAHLLIARTIRR